MAMKKEKRFEIITSLSDPFEPQEVFAFDRKQVLSLFSKYKRKGEKLVRIEERD